MTEEASLLCASVVKPGLSVTCLSVTSGSTDSTSLVQVLFYAVTSVIKFGGEDHFLRLVVNYSYSGGSAAGVYLQAQLRSNRPFYRILKDDCKGVHAVYSRLTFPQKYACSCRMCWM
jgi:hypothetical protein